MDVSIIIISYNTRELTLACLQSVYAQTRGPAFEVIVVDNQSQDGSADTIAEKFPQVRLIRSDGNLGFARANNLAAASAQGEWLLLLNPDTVILADSIERTLAFGRAHVGCIVGGRTYFGDGSLNYNSCHGAPTPWSVLCIGLGLSAMFRRSLVFNPEGLGDWQRNTVREVDAVTGCFFMLPRDLWNRLGGFDESFFMYGEETDFCLRARKVGIKSFICPDATLIHYGGASEGVRADKMIRLFGAKARLIQKHWHRRWQRFGIICLKLWTLTRVAGFAVIRHLRPDREASYRAWKSIWQRRFEWINGRKVVVFEGSDS